MINDAAGRCCAALMRRRGPQQALLVSGSARRARGAMVRRAAASSDARSDGDESTGRATPSGIRAGTASGASGASAAPYDVVFFGSDRVSVASLAALRRAPPSLVRSLRVVCADTAQPVLDFAARERIEAFVKPRHTPLASWTALGGALPDVGAGGAAGSNNNGGGASGGDDDTAATARRVAVVVSFGHFLPPALLARCGAGALNVHPSLLPAYRGAAPIQHALLNGERETGVSIITLDTRSFDAGRVLLQERVAIGAHERFGALTQRLATLGAENLMRALSDLPSHMRDSVEQRGRVTRAPRLSRDDARVHWPTSAAAHVYCQWRALGELFGGLQCEWRGRRLKLVSLAPPELVAERLATLGEPPLPDTAAAGSFVFDRRTALLLVRCADRSWLGVERVCVEGKSPVKARQFALGYKLLNGIEHLH